VRQGAGFRQSPFHEEYIEPLSLCHNTILAWPWWFRWPRWFIIPARAGAQARDPRAPRTSPCARHRNVSLAPLLSCC
jgi:hypothetical protein